MKSGKVWITSPIDLNDEDKQLSQQTTVAIDFYQFQLRRIGAYSVPISRVYEMQSQASKYVKQISGESVDQLIGFLKCHSDVFTITSDECVVLCEHMKRATINGHTITRIDAPIELDEKVYKNTRIIVNTYHGRQIIDHIFQSTNVVTVDLEGVNLGSVRGSITLVQLAFLPKHLMNENSNGLTGGGSSGSTSSGSSTASTGTTGWRVYPQIYLFDVWSNPNLVDLCLKRLLESNKIKKVFHGCEDDSYALHRDFGVVLNNFIDTQAAHTVITTMSNETERTDCDNLRINGQQAEAIGLNGLFELYGGFGSNPLKAVVKKRYVGNSHYWCYRPLTEEMIYYAAYDVYVLLGIYIKMSSFISKIDSQNQKLLEELNRKSAFGRICAERDRYQENRPNFYQNKRRQPFQQKRQTNYNNTNNSNKYNNNSNNKSKTFR